MKCISVMGLIHISRREYFAQEWLKTVVKKTAPDRWHGIPGAIVAEQILEYLLQHIPDPTENDIDQWRVRSKESFHRSNRLQEALASSRIGEA